MTLRRSFGWTSLQFVAVLAIELGGLAILARLLSPGDMGAYAAAFALLRLAMFLGGFGLNTVLIRAEAVDQVLCRQIVGIATIATVIILLLYAVGFWLVPPTPESAEYRGLLVIMLPIALVSCVSSPANALLQREMRFQALFWARCGSTVAYQALAIPLAWAGWGATSLAVGMLGSSLVFAVIAAVITGGAFLVWPSLKGAGGTMRFATVIFASNAVNEAREAGIVMLVGRMAGLAPLGILSRARDLVMKANNVMVETIMPVLVPHVYRSARNGEDMLANFRLGWSYLSAICLPAAVGLSSLASAIVMVLLGDQWGEVSVILTVLALGIAVQPLAIMTSTYMVAMGAEVPRLIVSLIHLVISLGLVMLTARDGMVDMAVCLVLSNAFMLLMLLVVLSRRVAITVPSLWQDSWRGLVLGIATGAPIWLIGRNGDGISDPVFIVVGFFAGCLCWLVTLFLVRHPFRAEVGILTATLLGRLSRAR